MITGTVTFINAHKTDNRRIESDSQQSRIDINATKVEIEQIKLFTNIKSEYTTQQINLIINPTMKILIHIRLHLLFMNKIYSARAIKQ
jgi:hypothetical protein